MSIDILYGHIRQNNKAIIDLYAKSLYDDERLTMSVRIELDRPTNWVDLTPGDRGVYRELARKLSHE